MADNDMQGNVCLVTYANTGIGKYTALALAKRWAHLGMICRNRAKGEVAQAEIKSMSGNEHVDLLIVDMSAEKYTDQYNIESKSRRVPCHKVA